MKSWSEGPSTKKSYCSRVRGLEGESAEGEIEKLGDLDSRDLVREIAGF